MASGGGNNPTLEKSLNSTMSGSAPTGNSGDVRSVPLVTRIGSLMMPSLNMNWGAAPAPSPAQACMDSNKGKAPMVDPVLDHAGNVCKTDVCAMEAMAAHMMKPGGLLESLLKCTPRSTVQEYGPAERFLSELLAKSAGSGANISLDGAFGNGNSVMIIFDGVFTHNTVIPAHFAATHIADLLPTIKLTGSSMVEYPVSTEYKDSKIRFGLGWLDFMAAEKVVMGDMGLFVLTKSKHMSMYLYDCYGVEKPMQKRPAIWDMFVAYHEEFPTQATAATAATTQAPSPVPAPTGNPLGSTGPEVNAFIVPDHVRAMRYNLGPRLFMTEALMERMAHVWLHYNVDYPLYGVTMIKSHMTTGIFYFCTPYSEMLPYMPKDVRLYYSTSTQSIKAKLKKRYGDGLARITRGWRTFVRDNDVQLDDVFVLAIKTIGTGIDIRAFPVAMV